MKMKPKEFEDRFWHQDTRCFEAFPFSLYRPQHKGPRIPMARNYLDQCHCGSGEPAQAEYDARGIFLFYACPKCLEEQKGKYRPEIFTDSQYQCYEQIDEDY